MNDFEGIYVDRIIQLKSENLDASHISGVWLDKEGNLRFIPSVLSTSGNQTMLTIRSPHNSAYTVIRTDHTFGDIQEHWAKPEIEAMVNNWIVQGRSNTIFAPNDNISRAEFTALLVRALGLSQKDSAGFPDVLQTEWYASDVGTAKQAGLISGDEKGNFNPQAKITRQEMAVMIVRAAQFGGANMTGDSSSLTKFTDYNGIASWAADAAAKTVQAGIIKGSKDSFAPQRNATRAETAVMLQRVLQYLKFIN